MASADRALGLLRELSGILGGTGLALMLWVSPAGAESDQGAALRSKILPRIGISEQDAGATVPIRTQFSGFLPLWQSPQADQTPGLLFLESQLAVGSEPAQGSVLLGYRRVLADQILGGYLAYDRRQANHNGFSQLGFGVERLGNWDIRLNANLPIGDRRQLVDRTTLEDSVSASTLAFQGKSLGGIQNRRFDQLERWESALTAIEAEVGGRIGRIGSGDLRAYGGLYSLSGQGIDSQLGWQMRLAAQPTEQLSLGLGLQQDGLFGTNLRFNIGLSWPGNIPSKPRTPRQELEARLASSIARNSTVLIDQQTRRISDFSQTFQIATNPLTGQPYQFEQVAIGATGNGTIEAPSDLAPALTSALTDGNGIVYVRGSNFPAVTVPANVRLLSTAVPQFIDTPEFGRVQLPESGTGSRPIVAGVTLGSGATISGLDVRSTGIPGIALANTAGTVTIDRTNVTATNAPALQVRGANNLTIGDSIFVSQQSPTSGVEFSDITGLVTMTGSQFTLTQPRVGVVANRISGNLTMDAPTTIANATAQGATIADSPGTVALANATITNSGDRGITADRVANLTLRNNRIDQARNSGVRVENSAGTIVLENNQITNTRAVAGGASSGLGVEMSRVTGTVALRGNTISGTLSNGLPSPGGATGKGVAIVNDAGNLDLTIATNTIANNSNDGIAIGAFGTSTMNIQVQGNQIRTNGSATIPGDGVNLVLRESAAVTTTIEGNTIESNRGDGIDLQVGEPTPSSQCRPTGLITCVPSTATLTATIRTNTIRQNSFTGIQSNNKATSTSRLQIQGNTISNNSNVGLFVRPGVTSEDQSQATAIINQNIFSNNTGADVFTLLSGPAPQRLCVQLTGNQANVAYRLVKTSSGPSAGTLQVVNLLGLPTANVSGVGFVDPQVSASAVSVPSCP
jgi:trimeric autotransporter adhesin